MPIQTLAFGQTPDGKPVQKFVLSNKNNISAEIMNYGGILVALNMPDKNGKVDNICLGFDDLDGYLGDHPYFGAVIGRFANRIAKGKFELDGKAYELAVNDGGINHLHGGNVGYDKVLWDATPVENEGECSVVLNYTSPDGEEGYPGTVKIEMTYTLTDADELKMVYVAQTDKATPINLTNHAYWNLGGAGSGNILGHELQMAKCKQFLPSNSELIPTGELQFVENTPFDFTSTKKIGQDIDQVTGGYDHCFVVERCCQNCFVEIAEVRDPKSGRGMKIGTTKPGVQLYTGNFLDNIQGAKGAVFNKQDAFCLETQFFPNAINQPNFPSCVLQPGETYKHVTVHKFFV